MPDEAIVADLIDSQNQWNMDLIYQVFKREDADEIIKIPLPRIANEDQVTWDYDRRGRHSVKSEYQIALRLKFPDSPAAQAIVQHFSKLFGMLPYQQRLKFSYGELPKNFYQLLKSYGRKKCSKNLDVRFMGIV